MVCSASQHVTIIIYLRMFPNSQLPTLQRNLCFYNNLLLRSRTTSTKTPLLAHTKLQLHRNYLRKPSYGQEGIYRNQEVFDLRRFAKQ